MSKIDDIQERLERVRAITKKLNVPRRQQPPAVVFTPKNRNSSKRYARCSKCGTKLSFIYKLGDVHTCDECITARTYFDTYNVQRPFVGMNSRVINRTQIQYEGRPDY